MAPEQTERPDEVDHRADIYALGVVLYQMLTGELPGKRLEAPSKKVQIDVRLDEIVLRALQKTPELRYQTAGEFRTQVESVGATPREANLPPSAKPASSLPIARRFSRLAVVGACWAPLIFISMFLWYSWAVPGPAGPPQIVPSGLQTTILGLVQIAMLVLGLAAPFGTTILGWVAVFQIRRSAGRLYGLRLAVFDGLLFPLLALDTIFFLAAHGGTLAYATLLLGLCALVDYIVVRRVWRSVNGPFFSPGRSALKPSWSRRKWIGAGVSLLAVAGLTMLAAGVVSYTWPRSYYARSVVGVTGAAEAKASAARSALQTSAGGRKGSLLEVREIRNTHLLEIIAWERDPRSAADSANAAAERVRAGFTNRPGASFKVWEKAQPPIQPARPNVAAIMGFAAIVAVAFLALPGIIFLIIGIFFRNAAADATAPSVREPR